MRLSLVYAALVILFGAWVRASLSGDGCGVSWPNCGGAILPDTSNVKTLIELTHRVTSGLLGLLLGGLWIAARRAEPKGSPMRRAIGFSVLACVISALIGAVLVRQGLVVHDKSLARAIFMPVHLVNNYFLMGALVLADWYSRGGAPLRRPDRGPLMLLVASGVSQLVLGITGAISAMGKTAYGPELQAAQTLSDRLNMHIGAAASPILKGGVAHPLLATSLFALMLWAGNQLSKSRPEPGVQQWSRYLSIGLTAQMLFGLANLLMSAPAWMQMGHLLLALVTWVSFVKMGTYTLAYPEYTPSTEDPFAGLSPRERLSAQIRAYVALTKPRVISLLLFTTVAAMVMANQGWPPFLMTICVALGGYMMAGAANTINMIVERDLDVAMERTASRPTVTHYVSSGNAFLFALALTVVSFGMITAVSNVLAALLAFAGLLFYVFIYTLLLKRRTWQNIVIGGAAGAFPPLVGWAAVTGDLNWFAWLLFAVVFLWTPVHFWALAILIKDDYAKAGVPMLPVVHGEHVTAVQIVIYAILTAVVSIIPLAGNGFNSITLGLVVLLNVGLLAQSLGLLRSTTRPKAKSLFKYSMVYLALFFLVVAVDRAI